MERDDNNSFGLGQEPRSQWPTAPRGEREPIDILRPDSDEHAKVLAYLLQRLNASERTMSRFHGRWITAEKKVQTYISLPDREQALREISDMGLPPQARPIVVPYMMATVSTIVTYLANVFLGRKPIFPISSRGDNAEAAMNMERVLQYQSDHTKLAYHLFRYFLDGEIYGLQVLKCFWADIQARRTVWRTQPTLGPTGLMMGGQRVPVKELRTVYQGMDVESVDPFMFFPDPSVPMAEVARKGEYVFFRSFVGYHALKMLEQAGALKYLDQTPRKRPTMDGGAGVAQSARGLLAQGDAHAGSDTMFDHAAPNNTYQVDQGSVEIIPAEHGLSRSEVPEKWIFTILNKAQIVQAEPWDADHAMHPVVVGEPYSFGYGFGQAAMTDWIGPIQDSVSWFINSHMQNVREAINNIFVYDPRFINEGDFKNPGPGMRIRLKPEGYGVELDKVFKQLPVADMTAGHVNDMELFVRIGDALTGVNDNLRGQPHQGGRKTATEVVASAESGSSRLANHARFISVQSIVDLTEQASLNTQQWLSEEMYLQVAGPLAMLNPIHVTPEMLVGDFYYPPHDGTLPINRGALFDVWSELMQLVVADPEIRATYSVPRIFEHVAELGGIRNMEQFRIQAPAGPGVGIQMMDDEQVEQQEQRGNVVPLQEFQR